MSSPTSQTESPSFQIVTTVRYDPEIALASTASDTYPPPRNSPYYLLAYHRDRLLSAAIHFLWDDAIVPLQGRDGDPAGDMALDQLAHTLDRFIPDPTRAWRLRVLLNRNGAITAEAGPTSPLSSHMLLLPAVDLERQWALSPLPPTGKSKHSAPSPAPWALRLDRQPTEPSAFTTHKTTVRQAYTEARERVGIKSPQEPVEVLMHNPGGEVMEGSITTVYFWRRQSSSPYASHDMWVTPPLSSGGNAGTTRRYALASGVCAEQVVRIEELTDGEEVWLSNALRGFIRAVLRT